MKTHQLLFILFSFVFVTQGVWQTSEPESEENTFRSVEDSGAPVEEVQQLDADFDTSDDLHKPFAKGTLLRINADMMYPINKRRLDFYRDMHKFIRFQADPSKVVALINSYESSLKLQEESFNTLITKTEELDAAITQSNQQSQQKIESVVTEQQTLKTDLANANKALGEVQGQLSEAISDIRKAKKNSFWTTVIAAAVVGTVVLIN